MGVSVNMYYITVNVCWTVDGGKPKEKPRAAKGCQLSRSAYMLVYRLRSLSAGMSTCRRLRNSVEHVLLYSVKHACLQIVKNSVADAFATRCCAIMQSVCLSRSWTLSK